MHYGESMHMRQPLAAGELMLAMVSLWFSTAVMVTVVLQYGGEYDGIGQNNVFARFENEAA